MSVCICDIVLLGFITEYNQETSNMVLSSIAIFWHMCMQALNRCLYVFVTLHHYILSMTTIKQIWFPSLIAILEVCRLNICLYVFVTLYSYGT